MHRVFHVVKQSKEFIRYGSSDYMVYGMALDLSYFFNLKSYVTGRYPYPVYVVEKLFSDAQNITRLLDARELCLWPDFSDAYLLGA
jgi:hypothetical protein